MGGRGLFEGGIEPPGSMKHGEFLNHLRNCQLLKKTSAPRSQSATVPVQGCAAAGSAQSVLNVQTGAATVLQANSVRPYGRGQ